MSTHYIDIYIIEQVAMHLVAQHEVHSRTCIVTSIRLLQLDSAPASQAFCCNFITLSLACEKG